MVVEHAAPKPRRWSGGGRNCRNHSPLLRVVMESNGGVDGRTDDDQGTYGSSRFRRRARRHRGPFEGQDQMKLTKTDPDADGEHHFIPLAWVDHVDEHVHLKQSGAEAKARWKTH